MKYFRTEIAGRRWSGIQFNIVAVIAGTGVGVFATESAIQAGALEDLMKKGGCPVTEITESEYQDLLKKKAPELPSFRSLSNPSMRTAIPPKSAPVVEAVEKVEVAAVIQPVETADEALLIGKPETVPPVPDVPTSPDVPVSKKKK